MAELTISADENLMYARAAARQLAESLVESIAAGVALIQTDPARKVRLALTLTIAVDGESGEIRPKFAVKRSESEPEQCLPGIPIGAARQLEMYGAGLLRTEE